jgi:hypothetical protein
MASISSTSSTSVFAGAAVVSAMLAFGHGSSLVAGADVDWKVSIVPLPAPSSNGSGELQLTAEGDGALLSWIERTGPRATLKFAERTETGWSEARTVISGTNLFVNFADVPSVRALADGSLAAHWLEESDPENNPEAYDLRLAWSRDRGRTWSKPISPHHDGTKTQHGFASLYQVAGGLGVLWLDGRKTNPKAPSDSPTAGDMALRATTFGPNGRQLGESIVAPRVCECCATAVAATSEGPIVAFRNRSPRDIYVSRFAGGRWAAPTPVHLDGWRIEACPINGPAIAARGRDVAVAWFTMQQDQGRAFVSFSHDAGETFGQPVRVDDTESRGRVGVALLPDLSAVVSWVEFSGRESQFKIRRVESNGTRSSANAISTVPSGTTSGFPRLVETRNELLLAWAETATGLSQIRTATLSVSTPAR